MPSDILGIDIGGSSIKAAPVDTGTGSILAQPKQVSLPESPVPDMICEAIGGIVEHFDWRGPLGCGYPGVVRNGIACSAAHVADAWLGVNLESRLREQTGATVRVINDADAAGLAEMRFGAGRDHYHADGGTVLMFTLGTGIGSALFRDGRLFPNTEFGHVYMKEGIEGEDMAAAAVRVREGLSWDVWGLRVNRFLEEMNKLLSPDLVIIGGGVSENFSKFGSYLKACPEIVPAKMGNKAGIIGAALALTLHFSNPTPDEK